MPAPVDAQYIEGYKPEGRNYDF